MIDQQWRGRCAMMSLNKKKRKKKDAAEDDGGVSSRKNTAAPLQLSPGAGVSNGNPPLPPSANQYLAY